MQGNACCTLPERNDLQNQLNEAERELASQTRQRASLIEDIASVQKTKTDVDQSGDAYGKALEGLKNSKKELDDYYETKSSMVECAVEKNKNREAIDAAIKACDDGIQLQQYKVQKLMDGQQEATSAYDEATSMQKQKQDDFDEYKDYKGKVERKLKDIQALKTKIEKEDDAHPPAVRQALREGEQERHQRRRGDLRSRRASQYALRACEEQRAARHSGPAPGARWIGEGADRPMRGLLGEPA